MMNIYGLEFQLYEWVMIICAGLFVIAIISIALPRWIQSTLLILLLIAVGAGAYVAYQDLYSKKASPVKEARKQNTKPGVAYNKTQRNRGIVKQSRSRAIRQEVPNEAVGAEEAPEAAAEPSEEFETVKVLYGTDREKKEGIKRLNFGDGRGKKLTLGSSVVTIPKNIHKTGEIERPFEFNFLWIKYQAKEDPKKHFTIHKIGELNRDEFINLSRQMLSKSKRFKDQAFVFVHGYNVAFDVALYRTAQMAYDLGFDGVPYMYSWPSVGGLVSYEYDQNSAQQARPYLRNFLDIVTKESGAKDVHIIAHSMGNAPLMEVLKELNQRGEEERVSNINQIILAAPDIDRDVFENLAKEITDLSQGITLYVSSADLAMKASRTYSGTIRAGDVPDGGPVIIEGIDTIDVTKLSTSVFSLNHSIYADSGKILGDITKLMLSQVRPPDLRTPELSKINSQEGQIFWRYDGVVE